MTRALAPIGLAAALLFAPGLRADDDDFRSCRDFGVRFEDEETARSEEKLPVPNGTRRLAIDPHENGGVSVRGWDRNEWEVTACKAAAGETQREADEQLARIQASLNGDRIEASGPGSRGWSVFFLVRAPRGAELDVKTSNGPVSVRDFTGKLAIRAVNGPVTTRNISGELDIDVQNGPVTLAGNRGKVDVKAQNGPLSLVLDGDRWDGTGLSAYAQNGPVTIRVPESYASGVLVTSSTHSPFRCRAAQCGNVETRSGRKTVELGTGEPVINVSTQNGPVVISNSKS